MSAAYVSALGKRWRAEVPRDALGWLVDRYHVSTPDNVIAADVESRIRATEDPRYTPVIVRQTVRYALLRHENNRALYRRVMRGM